MNRREHLAWCKQRALEYVDDGNINEALASMTSDLGKHDGTRRSVALCFLGLTETTPEAMRKFIKGFK